MSKVKKDENAASDTAIEAPSITVKTISFRELRRRLFAKRLNRYNTKPHSKGRKHGLLGLMSRDLSPGKLHFVVKGMNFHIDVV